jgi:hypothetical protein
MKTTTTDGTTHYVQFGNAHSAHIVGYWTYNYFTKEIKILK